MKNKIGVSAGLLSGMFWGLGLAISAYIFSLYNVSPFAVAGIHDFPHAARRTAGPSVRGVRGRRFGRRPVAQHGLWHAFRTPGRYRGAPHRTGARWVTVRRHCHGDLRGTAAD